MAGQVKSTYGYSACFYHICIYIYKPIDSVYAYKTSKICYKVLDAVRCEPFHTLEKKIRKMGLEST